MLTTTFLTIISISFSADVTFTIDGGNLNYDSSADIYGFQFNHDGCAISASGGDAVANGFTVSSSGTVVLGFSLTGSSIPSGTGTLVDLGSESCINGLSNFVISGAGGNALSAELSEGSSADHTVQLLAMSFDPVDLNIEVGDEVEWVWVEGYHNVNGSQNTFPNNPESFESESGSGLTFSHTFSTAGHYDYQCDPHANMGMVGTITVGSGGCMDDMALNYDPNADFQTYNEYGTSLCTYASCDDIPTATGCLWVDGTSSEWWDGWWNCEGATVCGLAEIVFELDLPDDISGTPHVQGTYNGWCGDCYNAMSDDDGDGIWSHTQYFAAGEVHEYKYSIGNWESDESVPSECSVEGTANRGFTAGDANSSQTLAHCWGSCDATCGSVEPPTEYNVTFDVDGVEDCGFVSVTGTWDNWSGWGAHTDNNMTASMVDGSYEYVILCVDNSADGWWDDIWGNSTIINAPSDCGVDNGQGGYNYTFSVDGADSTVSICAGSCDATCTEQVSCDSDVCFSIDGSRLTPIPSQAAQAP